MRYQDIPFRAEAANAHYHRTDTDCSDNDDCHDDNICQHEADILLLL